MRSGAEPQVPHRRVDGGVRVEGAGVLAAGDRRDHDPVARADADVAHGRVGAHRAQHRGGRCRDAQRLLDDAAAQRGGLRPGAGVGREELVEPAGVGGERDEARHERLDGLGAREDERADGAQCLVLREPELAHAPGDGRGVPRAVRVARRCGQPCEDGARVPHLAGREAAPVQAHEADHGLRGGHRLADGGVRRGQPGHRADDRPGHGRRLRHEVDALAREQPRGEAREDVGHAHRDEVAHRAGREETRQRPAQARVVGALHVEEHGRAEHGRPQVRRRPRAHLGEVLGVEQHGARRRGVGHDHPDPGDAHDRAAVPQGPDRRVDERVRPALDPLLPTHRRGEPGGRGGQRRAGHRMSTSSGR